MSPRKHLCKIVAVFSLFFGLFFSNSVSAATYQSSISTSGTLNLDVTSAGNGANITTDNVNIVSTCPAGYTVSIAATSSSNPSFNDTTLYKDGNKNNTQDTRKILSSTGTKDNPVSILGNNKKTWGYTAESNATINSNFIGLTTNQSILTTSSTGTTETGTTLPVYYGVSVDSTIEPGQYKMSDNAVITYYLTTSLDCTSYQVAFNPTAIVDDGQGGTTELSGTGTMNNQRIAEGQTTNLDANAFTPPSGYTFKEWNTAADGSGTSYTDKQEVTDLTTAGNTITLYAQWSAPAHLDTGSTVNQKLKRLAGNSSATYDTQDNTITALVRANSLPASFTPTDDNTISTSSSTQPIYAWYDSSNTTIYYYSDATDIKMNQDSSYFFHKMQALSDLSTISSWDTSSVTDMSYMFWSAGSNATTFNLDLSSWNTSSVTDMGSMFRSAGYNATTFTLNLSSWDTSSVTNMDSMFSYAGRNATTWSISNLSSWDTSFVTDMSHMFSSAGYSSGTWSVGDLSSWETASVTNMSWMFRDAGYNATTFTLNISSWDTSKVTNMSGAFSSAGYNATTFTLDVSSWNTASVTNMSYMFYYAGYNATNWSIGDLSSWNTSSVTNMSRMFYSAGYNATTFTLNISSWDTSKVTNMSDMFYQAGRSATTFTLDLSSWNTSSVTDMDSMFSYAGYNATTFALNISSWDTSKVTNMSDMFYQAGRNATTFTLDLSSWNTSSVTDMGSMFRYAGYNATTWSIGDLSSWDTSSVTNMSEMFNSAGYSSGTWSIGNLSSWNTANVTNMFWMFRAAGYNATTFTLNISSWDTSKVTNISGMFSFAGDNATTWSVTIPRTNGAATSPIANTTSRLYGKTTSTYDTPSYGKSFTLAN